MKTLQKMKKSVLFVFVAVLVLLTYGFISVSSTNDFKQEKEMIQTYSARSHAGDIAYKCGDGKCGKAAKTEKKSTRKAEKCGEGKCGEGKTKKSTQKETDKCGEAKCGEGKSEKKASRKKASKCGEGKCGKS